VRIAFGADEETALAGSVIEHLRNTGHEVVVVAYPERWPEVGKEVGEAVVAGRADFGVVCCWTGTGVSMAANKVTGVRAALCVDAETARGARKWNDANVLALSLRLTSEPVAAEIVDVFLSEPPDPSEADAIAVIS
jgi:ribose 5-phosphate isomerase B